MAMFAIPIFLNTFFSLRVARMGVVLSVVIVILVHGFVYGGGLDLEYALLIIPFCALLLSDERPFFYVTLAISFLAFVCLKIYFLENVSDFLPKEKIHIQVLAGLAILMLGFLGVYRFKEESQIARRQLEQAIKDLKKNNRILTEKESDLEVINQNLYEEIEERQRIFKALQSSEQRYKNFAHAASHDLKEPLRMIQSFSQLLGKRNKDHFDKSSLEYLEFILTASQRMNQLIQDLLEYSSLATRDIKLKLVDLNDILVIVKNNLHVQIAESNAIIHSEKLPTILGHSTFILQLFQNLISNAIKFRKPDVQPVINIKVIEKNGTYRFAIQDNGIGISLEYQQKIFEVFTRLHSKVEYDGSGIGLATSKKIVESLGGKISVESDFGKGATFHFTIPRKSNKEKKSSFKAQIALK